MTEQPPEFMAVVANATRGLSDPQLEARFLGTMFSSNSAFPKVAYVAPEDFAMPLHGEIWRVCTALMKEGMEANPVTMGKRLEASIGGNNAAYLAELAGCVGPSMQAPSYAGQVKDLANRRRAVELAIETIGAVGDLECPGDEIISRALGDFQKLASGGARRGILKREIAEGLITDLGHELPCYSTGIPGLDAAMGGGMFAGKLYGFAARKKVGKTILLGSVSHNLNTAGVRHLFIPLEMSPAEIEQRNAAREGGFNSVKFLSRDMPDLEKRVAMYAANMNNHTIYEHQPGATLDDVRAMISRAVAVRGVRGVFLDYLQLVQGKGRSDTEEYHTRMVAQELADIARREGIFVVIAAQLNQDGNTRGGEGLKLACDQYYVLHREKEQPGAWLENEESRYTPYQHVGNEDAPGLWLDGHGPHFCDIADRRAA